MEEVWASVWEFPGYEVSTHGRVGNRETGRILKCNRTHTGLVKVGLVKDRIQYTRSVCVLVADEFLEGKSDIFNTPVHKDGDQTNNRVDNLVWRPRWFAWKYARQFVVHDSHATRGPIVDVESGVIYETIAAAAVDRCLLMEDIWQSIVNQKGTFPTWQIFEFLK